MFEEVFKHLNNGNVIGIFPEGGSHDRPDLLPIKAGISIMTLGNKIFNKILIEFIKSIYRWNVEDRQEYRNSSVWFKLLPCSPIPIKSYS